MPDDLEFIDLDGGSSPAAGAHDEASAREPGGWAALGLVAALVLAASLILSHLLGSADAEQVAEPITGSSALPPPSTSASSAHTGVPSEPDPDATPPPVSVGQPSADLDARELSGGTTASSYADFASTHLVIALREEALFYDLATGRWFRKEAPRFWPDLTSIRRFGEGVLLPRGGDALAVSAHGETSVIGHSRGWIVGANADTAFVVDLRRPAGEAVAVLDAIAPDGSRRWQRVLEPGQFVLSGATSDGRVAVQSGSSVLLVGPDAVEPLADGVGVGVVDDWLLFGECGRDLCRGVQLDVSSGARRPLVPTNADPTRGWSGARWVPVEIDPFSDVVLAQVDSEMVALRMIDGRAHLVDGSWYSSPPIPARVAFDAAGVRAEATEGGVVLVLPDGTRLGLRVPVLDDCCPIAQVAFVGSTVGAPVPVLRMAVVPRR